MKKTRVAFLDASVLYPALLRDIFMRLALHGLFQAHWSPQVQDEWCAALRRNRPDLEPDQIDPTRSLMERHMPDASVTGFEHRIESLVLPDAGDRHVLAAAIHCGAHYDRHVEPPRLSGRRFGEIRSVGTPSRRISSRAGSA